MNRWSGRRVLVTGGCGFIGSNLTHTMEERGADVTVVDAGVPGTGWNERNLEGASAVVIAKDIKDGSLRDAVENSDLIFNLAARTSHVMSMKDPHGDTEHNLLSHVHFLETCRKHGNAPLVYTGSRSQYGSAQYSPVDEDHPLQPVDINGVNKTAAERLHLVYGDTYGMNVTSLRLTNVYGPRMPVRSSGLGFAGYFIGLALRGKELELWYPDNRRDLLYVEDCVDALTAAPGVGGVFNIASGTGTSLKGFAAALAEITGCSYAVKQPPKERDKIEVGDFVSSIDKAKQVLNWSPKTGLAEGLKKTIDFYAGHGDGYL